MTTPAADFGHTVIVFHLGGHGGPARSLMPMTAVLARDGAVDCLVPESDWVARAYGILGEVTEANYSAVTYAGGPLELMRLGRRLAREARGFRRAFRRRAPDQVIVVSMMLPAALLAARLEGIPTAVYAAELLGSPRAEAPPRRLRARLLIRTSATLADEVVCCSEAVARQFGPRSRASVTYPPIAPDLSGGSRHRGRARYGLGQDPCVAVVGAISRGRGQDLAIAALSRVRHSIPQARLLIVGEPHPRAVDLDFAEQLHRQTRELGLGEAVIFAGGTDDMADVYAAADVVVNPARVAEAFGRVAPEAAVAGRPTISARVGAVEEIVRDGQTGLLVPPEDAVSLAAAIVRLLRDPALGSRLAAAGAAEALARFSAAADQTAWTDALARLRASRRPDR